jgi:hypothetical protein
MNDYCDCEKWSDDLETIRQAITDLANDAARESGTLADRVVDVLGGLLIDVYGEDGAE